MTSLKISYLFFILMFALVLWLYLLGMENKITAFAVPSIELPSIGNGTAGAENATEKTDIDDTPYGVRPEATEPVLVDAELKLERIASGLSVPSQMSFIGPNDILVLEKDSGMVKRVLDGTVQSEPLLDVSVATAYERGLLGIAVMKNDVSSSPGNTTFVYLYYTESKRDGKDVCSDTGTCKKKYEPLGNHLYRYELINNKLVNPKLLLDLPAWPGAVHNGGAILLGPDKNLYIPIGEVGYQSGLISNNAGGRPANSTGGILRITLEGKPVASVTNTSPDDTVAGNSNELVGIISHEAPLNKYYAYGIRNSFGLDFDPVTGTLWDTENGPGFGDEINVVEPGFNSGWNRVAGMWEYQLKDEEKLRDLGLNYYGGAVAGEHPHNLVDFGGRGKYSSPEFVWNQTVGVTALKFLGSDKLGKAYQDDLFVGDVHNGNLYHFDLSADRKKLVLDEPLNDMVANNQDELKNVILGKGFNGITDIEVGPDRNLYVLSFAGSIFRITSELIN